MADNPANESLIDDAFDREYGLVDLLPIDDLKDISISLDDLFDLKIFQCNGRLYFSSQKDWIEPPQQPPIDPWSQSLITEKASEIMPGGYWEEGRVLFMLQHEGEPIGYFSVVRLNGDSLPQTCFKAVARMLLAMINRLIRLNCKVQMTSGLQSQVVEDSYAQLQVKADQLAQSEQKYRLLAESLEVEVAKKTQTIQRALTTLAQQEKMASVGQLAAGVAHEINNPMGFIISNLGSLKEYGRDLQSFFKTYIQLTEDSEKLLSKEDLQVLKKLYVQLDIDYILTDLDVLTTESSEGAERVKKIVMDLKEFSKPGLHDAVAVDVNKLLQNVLRVCHHQIGDSISINTDCKPLPLVLCHPQEINQAIINIILNAVQAMDGKGTIHVSTSSADQQVRICIEDSGKGIDNENLAKIFDPFFTTKTVGSGTGLGLTFAYNVIRKHNGKITVESQVNRGSRFTLFLPAGAK